MKGIRTGGKERGSDAAWVRMEKKTLYFVILPSRKAKTRVEGWGDFRLRSVGGKTPLAEEERSLVGDGKVPVFEGERKMKFLSCRRERGGEVSIQNKGKFSTFSWGAANDANGLISTRKKNIAWKGEGKPALLQQKSPPKRRTLEKRKEHNRP